MSGITMAVSVEGLAFEAWDAEFRRRLAALPGAAGVLSEVAGGTGVLRAGRGASVKVRTPEGSGPDALQVLGLVISALSLAIAATQFVVDQGEHAAPAGPVFVCRVEGPKGVSELRIEGAAIPSEAVLRKCLDATGKPTHVKAVVTPKRP